MKKSLVLVFVMSIFVLGCNNDKSSGTGTSPTPATEQKPGFQGGTATASCLMGETCVEWGNWIESGINEVKNDCQKEGGNFANSLCPTSGQIGLCDYSTQTASQYTVHYYAGAGIVSDLKMGCERSHGKFFVK